MKKKQIDIQFIQVSDYLQKSQKVQQDNDLKKKNSMQDNKQELNQQHQHLKNESPQKWINNQSTSTSLKQQNSSSKIQIPANNNCTNTPKNQILENQGIDKITHLQNLEKIKENLNKKLQYEQQIQQQIGGSNSGGGRLSGKQYQSSKNSNQSQTDLQKIRDTNQNQNNDHARVHSNDNNNKNEYNFINSTNIIFEKLKKKKLSINQNNSINNNNSQTNNSHNNMTNASKQQLQKTLQNNYSTVQSHHNSMLNINNVNCNSSSITNNNCNSTADTGKGHRKVCSLTTFQPKVNKENMFIDLSKQQYNIISQIDLKKFINNRQQKDSVQKQCGCGSCNNSITNNNISNHSNTFNATSLNNYFSPQNQNNNSKRENASRQQSQKRQQQQQQSQINQTHHQNQVQQSNIIYTNQKASNNNNMNNSNSLYQENYNILNNNNMQQIYLIQTKLEDIVKNKLDETQFQDIIDQMENLIKVDSNMKSSIKLIKDSITAIFTLVIQKNQNLQISALKGDQYKKDIENLTKERNLLKNKISYIEKENQKFEQILAYKTSLKQQEKSTQTKKSFNDQNIEILKENNILKEYIIEQEKKIQLFKEKESKMIKLLLAIQRKGIDIDSIYNNDVLNDDECSNSEDPQQNNLQDQQILKNQIEADPITKQFLIQEDVTKNGYADNSIINDSDESSFNYFGKPSQRDQSIINLDYVKNFNKVIPESQPKIDPQMQKKLQLNLLEVQKQRLENPSSDSDEQPQQQQQQQQQQQMLLNNNQLISDQNIKNQINMMQDNLSSDNDQNNMDQLIFDRTKVVNFNNINNKQNLQELIQNQNFNKKNQKNNKNNGQQMDPDQLDFIPYQQNMQILNEDLNNSWNIDSDVHQQSF